MPRYLSFPEPPQPTRMAVVLVNLGTPDAPDTASVRRYLAEFLADPRIVEQPRWLWWLVLNGIILRFRPARSARNYAKVWTTAGSPLQVRTRALAEALQEALEPEFAEPIVVRHAMRYGSPGISEVLSELAGLGMRRLLVLPLFPQFSATTTASVLDAIGSTFRNWRFPPELRFINDYHVDPAHIDALARSVEKHWAEHGRAQRLLLSFHGIPERYVRNGDPYRDQCLATTHALRKRLGMSDESLLLSFQSRLGREPWLQPYTDQVLEALPTRGVHSVEVLCPGFAVDCLETLEEIAITGREQFEQAGGDEFQYIPCLNDSEDQLDAIKALVLRHAQGWPELRGHASASGTELSPE